MLLNCEAVKLLSSARDARRVWFMYNQCRIEGGDGAAPGPPRDSSPPVARFLQKSLLVMSKSSFQKNTAPLEKNCPGFP